MIIFTEENTVLKPTKAFLKQINYLKVELEAGSLRRRRFNWFRREGVDVLRFNWRAAGVDDLFGFIYYKVPLIQ